MKKIVVIIALLVSATSSFGGTNPAAQEVLLASKQQADIFHDQPQPFQLEVDFRLQLMIPMQGHLTWKWEAEDRWWRKIVMSDFEQTDVRIGDMLYIKRNINFTPPRVKELIGLLEFAQNFEGKPKKQKQHFEDGILLTCLKVERKNSAYQNELCLNSDSHDILSSAWSGSMMKSYKERYTDYVDFGVHRYPRRLQLSENGSNVITATIQSLTAAAFDEKLLTVPKGAIERRQCDHMRYPVEIEAPYPKYSGSSRESDMTAVVTVLTDGSVSDVQLIGSDATRSMDEATLQTLKSWKFKPAMCGADPVVSDIQVFVSFRLR